MGRMIRFVAGLVLLLGTLSMRGELLKADCRQIGANRYRIDFTVTKEGEALKIFASTDPDGSGSVAVGTATSSPFETVAGKAGERIYFFLKPAQGATQEVSIRRLQLQGAANVRDLGGYPTTDGRAVRWGLLYRANELGHLSPADLTYLQQLKIKLICDFRTEEERQRLADRWIETPDSSIVSNSIGSSEENGKSSLSDFQRALAHDPQPAQLHQLMVSAYQNFALAGAPAYRKAFREIIDGRLPFLFHCSAGKDRTGLFSAMLLLTLGAPRQVVTSDYLLSNQYLLSPESIEQTERMMKAAMPNAPAVSPEVAKVLLGVDKDYLDAALVAIDRKYGSFEQYRRDALGVTDAEVVALRATLLSR